MSTARLTSDRKYPSLPAITREEGNVQQALTALKESLDIGARRTADIPSSFVRVRDLIDLGIIRLDGNIAVALTVADGGSTGGGSGFSYFPSGWG